MSKWYSSKLISLFIIFLVLYFTYSTGIPRIFTWDAFGQYIYLPMIFDQGQLVYHDLNYFDELNKTYNLAPSLYQFVTLENGNFMTKYTMGFAVLSLPFYLLAELWANLGGYTSDGFTFPYQLMSALGSSFYFVVGIIYLRKLLLNFFKDGLTSFLMMMVVFGTNFLFMQYASVGSTHNFEFTLVCLMLYYNIQFHKNQNYKNGIILSLSIGLIGLVRLPDLMLVLIPIFWKRSPQDSVGKKILDLFKTKKNLLIMMILIPFSLLFLQLFYWKINAGTWLMNSYANNPGEGFDWFQPYVLEILFSFRKGWFIYTPLMFFAVIGLYFLYKKAENGKILTFTFFLFFYLISCWTTWWYADSYSCRALVDFYPILTIALGYLCLEINAIKIKSFFYTLVLGLILLNLFQTWQISKGIIPTDRMSKAYYLSVFGQLTPPTSEQHKLLLLNRSELFQKREIDFKKFHKTLEKTIRFPEKVLINDSNIYAPKVGFRWTELSHKKYFWLKVKWEYEGTKKQLEGKIFNMCATHKDKAYSWEGFQISDTNTFVNDSLQIVEFLYFTPHFRTKKDLIHFGLWKQSGEAFYVKSVSFEVFEPYFENE